MNNKIFFRYIFVFLLLLPFSKISSQCVSTLATTPDLIALPTNIAGGGSSPACPAFPYVTTSANTGTDIYFDGNTECQVIVWDGTNASFSWKYGALTGSVPFNGLVPGVTLTDPDVVVHASPLGGVYAVLVAEVTTGTNAGKIYWSCLKWGGANFTVNSSGYLGLLTNGNCKNPNIDVNSCGRVAIAWAQRINFNVTINVSGAPAGLNFGPISLNMARGDIFVAQGFIDGRSCSGGLGLGGITVASGDRASTPSFPMGVEHLFEVNINPDICISEPRGGDCSSTEFIISISYINQWFDPAAFAIKSLVVAKQFKGLNCVSVAGSYNTFQLNCGNYPGKPRIASRPDNTIANVEDFQIVMADPSASCNPAGPPCNPWNTKVYNWGKHNGVAPATNPSILTTSPINGCNLTSFYNNEAVVTYRNTNLYGANPGDYVVAWTNGGNVAGGVAWDIVAKTYNQGNVNLAAIGSTRISIVNRGCLGVNGNQYLPSIAGRYSKPLCYAYYDVSNIARPYIAYKATDVQPGSTSALKASQNFEETRLNQNDFELKQNHFESFTVQPNPFTDEIFFNIILDAGNKATSIEITDAAGRIVKIINSADKNTKISWKPEASLSAGIYYAKLKSEKSTIVTQILKAK